jgi:hypothetical protein
MSGFSRPEWFGGNQDALNMAHMLEDLAHIWDDLVDRDKPVSELQVNRAFLTCLVYLPANPFYRSIQDQVMPFWLTVVSAYETANHFERTKDPQGVEIAHVLRFAAANIFAYAMHVCLGPDRAREMIPQMWKAVVDERFETYRKEIFDADS